MGLLYTRTQSAFMYCLYFVNFTTFVCGFLRPCTQLDSQMHFVQQGLSLANKMNPPFQLYGLAEK